MIKFFVVMLCLSFGHGVVFAKTDVEFAEEARKILWEKENVGRGSEIVCESVDEKSKSRPKCKKNEWDYASVLIKRPAMNFVSLKIRMDTCESLSPGFETTCVRNYRGELNGLNTCVVVLRPFGYKVYAMRRLTPTIDGRKEGVYSPYCDAINSPVVVAQGKKYLEGVIDQAIGELKRDGVMSRAKSGTLVADSVYKDVVHRLALIEHIDPHRFQTEPIDHLVNVVYTTLALNKSGAYSLAANYAAANGLFQVIPKTYHMLAEVYPKAMLAGPFIEGTRNHVNAAKAAMLLLDYNVGLLGKEQREIVFKDKKIYSEFGSSAYNGKPSRPVRILKAQGDFVRDNDNGENKTYVLKMRALTNRFSFGS